MTNADAAPKEESVQTTAPAEGTQQNQTSNNDVQSIFKPGGVKPPTETTSTVEKQSGQQSQQGQTQQPNTSTQQQGQQQQTQQSASIDPKVLAQSIVEAQTRAQQQMKQSVAPEMTDAEFNKKYGVYAVTAQDVQSILDADPVKAAASLNNLLDAKVRQAILMSKGYISSDLESIRSQLTPMQQYRQQQQERELMTEFKALNQDLKDEDVLIETFARAYQSRGQTFNGDKQLAFTTLANDVRNQIARLRGSGGGQQGSQQSSGQQQTQQRQSSRQMTPVLTGGRSGSGPAKPVNDIELIFKGGR